MRLLLLGGTVFLGRAVARHARDAGHEVVCAARGASGEPVDGVRFVRVDRADPDGFAELTGDFDAVVDVARTPSHVRHALDALAGRVGHATFVSTCSVYADHETPGQLAEAAPLLDPAPEGFDAPSADATAYGRCKVTCERAYLDMFGAERVFVCRAGLIVGPEDPSGRFGYWVGRMARGGEVLAPGAPEEVVQVVDVRDLAAWIVEAAERGLVGTFDGIGAPMPRGAFLDELRTALAPTGTTLTWVDGAFLTEHQVNPWSGPRSLPLWLPLPGYAGFLSRDTSPARAAGLRTRSIGQTARASLAAGDTGNTVGLTAEEEADLLHRWHSR